jgi:cell division protein FtsQ
VRVDYTKGQPKVDTERKRQQRPARKSDSPGSRLATAKRQERERRQVQFRNRRIGVIGVIVVAVAVVIWGIVAIVNAPVLRVRAVTVEGNVRLSDSEVTSQAAIAPSTTMLSLSAGAIERRLLADPWIAAATVSRRFPATIVIDVTERVPLAVVDVGGSKLWLASADGRWLSQRSEDTSGSFITIRDVPDVKPVAGRPVGSPEVANALRVVAGISSTLRKRVVTVSAASIDKTALITSDDIEIFVGSATDIAIKDGLALRILREQRGKVVYINVRSVDRPTWRGLDVNP